VAANKGHTKRVELLLEHINKLDANKQTAALTTPNNQGKTPLANAVQEKKRDVVLLLLQTGHPAIQEKMAELATR